MQQQFVGLTMPVFIAFGWAGEETALKFALSQLEQFIGRLHADMSRQAQTHLPFFGMNPESQSVYLASNQDPEEGVYIAFNARPMSLEIQLAITNQMALSKALKAAAAQPQRWRQLLQDLGAEWQLHVKQMQVDEESAERSSYQDLFKDSVASFDADVAESVASRAQFLNGEPQWVTPLYLSKRLPSEQVAVMNTDVVRVMAGEIERLIPVLEFMMGRVQMTKTKQTKKKTPVAQRVSPDELDPERQFVYVTSLKPLHLRRGFVNLTPQHWDFFARNARATTRSIVLNYEGRVDNDSAVWHLSSNDMARIVLSEPARDWMYENFEPEDKVQVRATLLDNDEIEVVLEAVE